MCFLRSLNRLTFDPTKLVVAFLYFLTMNLTTEEALLVRYKWLHSYMTIDDTEDLDDLVAGDMARDSFRKKTYEDIKKDFKRRLKALPDISQKELVAQDIPKMEKLLQQYSKDENIYFAIEKYIKWLKNELVSHKANYPGLQKREVIGHYIKMVDAGFFGKMLDADLARFMEQNVTYGESQKPIVSGLSTITKVRGNYTDRHEINEKLNSMYYSSSILTTNPYKKRKQTD